MTDTQVTKLQHGLFSALEKTEVELRLRNLVQADHLMSLDWARKNASFKAGRRTVNCRK